MAGDTFELTDAKSTEALTNVNRTRGGCFLSTALGFFMVILSIVITVVVALIVFFATDNRNIACKVEGISSDTGTAGAISGDDVTTTKLPTTKLPATLPTVSGGLVTTTQTASTISDAPGWVFPDSQCIYSCIKEGFCDATTVPPTASPSDPTEKVNDVRLPLWLIPLEYNVLLIPNIYESDPAQFTNTGEVEIVMRCDEATDRITIHINKLTVTAGSYSLVAQDGSSAPAITGMTYDLPRQFVNFTLNAMLEVGKNYKLSLGYEGPLSNDLTGLYWSNFTEVDPDTGIAEQKFIATSQMQPTDARKAFPCFDEPALKATFKIRLKRKPEMTSLSNMPLETTSAMPDVDGYVTDTFQTTVKMSTYLLAFVVCDFAHINGTTAGGTEFRVWARKSAISQANYSLPVGISILEYFENYFDEGFPLPKQDMIAIPDFAAGAMENWGLITYRETALLYDENVSAASNKQRVAVVVSHELAHQWFGNLVSPSWWDDLWLNEGFASYVEYIGVDHYHPSWEMMEQFVTTDVHSTLVDDSFATSHPIYVPVGHPDEINEIFDGISYGKGASLIRMMNFFLGENVFRLALADYINTKKYSDAFHDDLWAAMQKEADRQGLSLNVKEILDTWILQMGYPVVTISEGPTAGDGKVTLQFTQKHFLVDDSQTPDPRYPSPYGYTWDIPLSIVSSEQPDFNVNFTSVQWFSRADDKFTVTFDTPPEWLVVNAKQYGFYRVNYPPQYWNKLINQLNTDHTVIDPLNRAQIIDDSFNLALAGELSIEFAMQTTKYLSNEISYFPWDAALNSLSHVRSALRRTQAYGDFTVYMQRLVEPLYNLTANNWVVEPFASITDQYLQTQAISRACSYDVLDCRMRASEWFKNWMNDPDNNPIHPNIRSTVYCNAIRSGGAAEWEFAFSKFQSENVAVESVKLLQSLGCTKHMWLLQRLLDYAVDESKIRKQDAYIAVGTVASNDLGHFMSWDWLRGNWDELYEKFKDTNNIPAFVYNTAVSFGKQIKLEQIQEFMDKHKDLGSASRAFDQAKEATQANIKYLDRNYQDLEQWLKNNVNNP